MEMTCTIEGCTRPVRARGWCTRHYSRWARTGDPTVARVYGVRECGTETAHSRHIKRGEEPCDECREAHNEYQREARQQAREARQARGERPGHRGAYIVPRDVPAPPSELVDDHDGTGVTTPCQMDPEAWFPASGDSGQTAKEFCQTCPVIDACRTYVMDLEKGLGRDMRHGIWAGMTVNERVDEERRVAHLERLGIAA